MTRGRLLALALVPATALSLAGCQFAGSSPKAATTGTPTAPPATVLSAPTPSAVSTPVPGSTSGNDRSFSVVVPTGWKDDTPRHKTTVMFLQSDAPSGRFYPTFNVIRQTPGQLPALDDVVQQGEIALRQGGATVTPATDRTIGGLPAKGYVATRTVNGTTIVQTQYFVIHEKAVYTTTMSADSGKRAQADQTQNSILGTWAWAPATATTPPASGAATGTPSGSPTGRSPKSATPSPTSTSHTPLPTRSSKSPPATTHPAG